MPAAREGAVARRAHVSVGPGTGEIRVCECFPKEPQSSAQVVVHLGLPNLLVNFKPD